MSFVPGVGIVKGMAVTLRRFFEPKVTVKYPEERYEVAPRLRRSTISAVFKPSRISCSRRSRPLCARKFQ